MLRATSVILHSMHTWPNKGLINYRSDRDQSRPKKEHLSTLSDQKLLDYSIYKPMEKGFCGGERNVRINNRITTIFSQHIN